MPIVIAMNRKSLLLVLLIAALPSPCFAQSWGWPPASYTAGGIRYSDCSQFRGICDFLRDRGWGMRLRRGCSGYASYPSCVHTAPTTARPGCGCGGGASAGMTQRHLALTENQEPPLLTDSTNLAVPTIEPLGPVLLAPEEMNTVDLDMPAEAPPH
ncbi:MAG: hypothetical protein FJ271_10350 [Planctomycetes bacterium]|nr:hypothetical protein [Planctomycetota bacterium]